MLRINDKELLYLIRLVSNSGDLKLMEDVGLEQRDIIALTTKMSNERNERQMIHYKERKYYELIRKAKKVER